MMNLIQEIYNPLSRVTKTDHSEEFSVKLLRFSLGRQAIFQTVHYLNTLYGKNIVIGVPRFICRDVPEAISAAGGIVEWYGIERSNLRKPLGNFENCDAVLAVNFFGMAASLSEISDKIIIEDNAHGLFSKNDRGQWLGTRSDFGIFSLRKTLPVSAGAGLFLSEKWDSRFYMERNPDIIENGISKVMLRKIAATLPPFLFLKILQVKRLFSRHQTDESTSDYSPKVIYYPEHLLRDYFVEKERQRRRQLYDLCNSLLKVKDYQDYIEIFPFKDEETPYCFPFYLKDKSVANKLKKYLNSKGLDLVNWPNLPDIVLQREEEWYHSVYFIPFVW